MLHKSANVLVVELNEITWDLMDPLMERGKLPTFRRLVQEGVRGAPRASEALEHLDPWVTWTTLYTGVPQEQHRVTMLEQDRESIRARRVWEYAENAGLRLGMFGSANTWPPQKVEGFWVPGPFSQDFSTYPKELEPIQALNVGLTRGHNGAGARMGSIKRLLPGLLRRGLRPSTCLMLAREMAAIRRSPSLKWRLIALQPLVNVDLFLQQYKRFRPQFATFHSNHVAYYQHRFWRAMAPDLFDVPPTEDEVATYGGCIEHGYAVADQVVDRLRRAAGPNVNLVILSSCGQQPATGGRYSEDQRNGNLGLNIRIEVLLDILGIRERVQYGNLMAPQWKVDFEDEELLQDTVQALRAARNETRDVPTFAAEVQGKSICLGANRNQQMDDTIGIPTSAGVRKFRAGDMLFRHAEVAKSGRHHPKGVLLMHGPDIGRGNRVEECDNLDIAPTLLTLLGVPVPSEMKGKVLTPLAASSKRDLVPAF